MKFGKKCVKAGIKVDLWNLITSLLAVLSSVWQKVYKGWYMMYLPLEFALCPLYVNCPISVLQLKWSDPDEEALLDLMVKQNNFKYALLSISKHLDQVEQIFNHFVSNRTSSIH